MTIDRSEAAAALDDIERVVARMKQSRVYRTASATLIMWGVIVATGYCLSYALPSRSAAIWIGVQLFGTAMTIGLSVHWRKASGDGVEWRIVGLMLLLFGFGLLWSVGLGKMGPREMNAFWATLFMFGYTVAGLWFGRAFIVLGLAITALAMAGYQWAGPFFEPYMAVVDGGGLIVCGLWMRRA